MMRESCCSRRIQGCGTDRILQTPARELSYIPHCLIHGENTAGKFVARFASNCAASVPNFDLYGPQLVGAIGHASGSHCIGNEHRAFDAFRMQEKLHHFRRDVNPIRDNVRGQSPAGQNFAKNARFPMIEWTHGIEGVSGVPGTGLHRSLRGFQGGIRVTDAHTNSAPLRFRNHLDCPGKLRRDSHHAHVTARCLPKAVKYAQSGLNQIFRRMRPAALVTKKRSFQVNAQRKSLYSAAMVRVKILCHLDRVRDSSKSGVSLVERCSDRCGEVTGNPMRRQKSIETRQISGTRQHDINSCASVHVNVDKTRRQNGMRTIAGKVNDGRRIWDLLLSSRGNTGNEAVLDKQQRIYDLFPRSIKTMSAENDHDWLLARDYFRRIPSDFAAAPV